MRLSQATINSHLRTTADNLTKTQRILTKQLDSTLEPSPRTVYFQFQMNIWLIPKSRSHTLDSLSPVFIFLQLSNSVNIHKVLLEYIQQAKNYAEIIKFLLKLNKTC